MIKPERLPPVIAAAGLFLGLLLGVCGQAWTQGKSPLAVEAKGETLEVLLRHSALDGYVSLTLPELINDATRRIVYTDTNLRRVSWRKDPDGTLRSAWRQEGLASYQLIARPERDGLALDWTIQNLESGDWDDAAANICMRSHHLPAHFDPSGARVFLRRGGEWVSLQATGEKPGHTWYLPPGKGILPLMQPHLEHGEYRISGFHPDEALIAVLSKDGRFVLAQAWQEARYLLANLTETYACTESPPALGHVAAGRTVRLRGMIYWFRGGLADLQSKYQADLRQGRIALLAPR